MDGVPVNDPGGEFNLGHLTSGDIDRIEVIRGPESALFGAEAAAGVVQVFTRRGDPESIRPRGSFSYERGSFQTDAWRAGLSGGSGDRLDYSLHAEQFRTAGRVRQRRLPQHHRERQPRPAPLRRHPASRRASRSETPSWASPGR